ncbi:NAD(+)/NADH kinase [Subtercola sp. PAMC28395]|uniref:diacylglycerol/lipid kinase family protein n=1 Tax=Subtercola sp. PAMC28395 TaxID=2846775 RepID=UPI001C0DCAC3|nr:diacylglycerol kinase family protein [Subtercola sp. PAMC28395]QWT25335.1 NAD(+)/NADH kinase [Subtercola sp. PAMC28395]
MNAARLQQKTAAIVYNPIKVDLEELRAALQTQEAANNWGPTLWLETSEDDPGEQITRTAVEKKVDVVIAAGGDGTVRAVAESLRGTGIPLALLPSGTGNLLARNLALTLDDMTHSLETAFTGANRSIDLGVIDIERADSTRDRHAFLVMAGLGIDAKMIANTNSELKKRVGWLAYVQAITLALRDKDELRFRYRLGDHPTRALRAHTLIIGNCGSLPANMLLLPDAAVDDGVFDIVMLRPKGFFGWVQIWARVAWENGIIRRTAMGRKLMGEVKEVRAMEYDKGESVTARFSRAEHIELDGDAFGEAVAFKTWVDAGSLVVRIPAEVAADSTGDDVGAGDAGASDAGASEAGASDAGASDAGTKEDAHA